jgi:hypothetical protein
MLGEPDRESTIGGWESAWRLQRAWLSQLCQGAENPKEVIGIWGGSGNIYVVISNGQIQYDSNKIAEFNVYAHELGILKLDMHQILDFANYLMHDLGNSVFNAHQVPKVLTFPLTA